MAVQIILKNSSIEDKRPQASQLTNGEISLNYSSAGAFLCCTDTNGDVQQVGGVKIDETAPDAPVKQTLWFKPSTLTLSVYDGDKWLPIAGGGGGGGGGGGDIIQVIGNDGIDADTVAGIVTLDVELAGGDDGLEFKSSKLSATLASATDLGSVKVGDNINVTAGKISVPKATSSTFGVVKLGDGITIEGDGSISIDVPTTTTYRGSCDLNNPPTGQINPDPALKGDAYINAANTVTVDAGWTGITGSANSGDLVIFDGTSWDLIPVGAGTAPVTSVNTKTGDVVLDYTDVGAASAAQGALADTALQPGDNISELNNDEGYITAAEAPVLSVNGKTGVVVLDAADVGALAPGDNVSELANDAGYITLAEIPAQKPPVISSATAPTGADAVEGNLWFNTNDGRTYVYYKDGDSSQWVDASPDSGGAGGTVGDYWLEAGGYLSPKTGTNGVDIGGSKILLKSDGNADFGASAEVKIRPSIGQLKVTSDSSTINIASVYVDVGDTSVFRFPFYVRADGKVTYRHFIGSGVNRIEFGNDLTVFSNIVLDAAGSSQFAGDMKIGTTGSFTPSTPAITLAADGDITTVGRIFGDRFTGLRVYANSNIKSGNGVTFRAADVDGTVGFRVSDRGTVQIGGTLQGLTPDNIPNIELNATTGDIQSLSQNGAQIGGFRNQLINGDFRVWQRGDDFSIPDGGAAYTADRWFCPSEVLSIGKNGNDTPKGFDYAIVTKAAGERLPLKQAIELGKAGKAGQFINGSTWTLSFWAKGSGTGQVYDVSAGFADGASDNPSTYMLNVTGKPVTTTWTRYTETFTIANSPSGTDTSLNIFIVLKNGDGFNYISGCQLEPGPVATPFEHRPIGTELALCQRYFQVVTGTHGGGYGYNVPRNSVSSLASTILATPMRVNPTATGGHVRFLDQTGNPGSNYVPTYSTTKDSIRISYSSTSNAGYMIPADTAEIQWIDGGSPRLLDAEL